MQQIPKDVSLKLSVVIASKVGPPFIDDCLESIEKEAKELGAEVIIVASGTEAYASRIAGKFPWVNVVHVPHNESVPALRCRGVAEARGEFVAIIEEHCLAAQGWLHRALAAHESGDYGAVGGPIVDYNYARLRDWVVYFCEYNSSLPPAPEGEVYQLNGANIAYRRSLLTRYFELLGEGYWEAVLHPAALADGAKLLSVPDMIVHHRGPFNFGYYLRQRYLFSRAFAGARAQSLSAPKRFAYLIAAPVVPGLLLARMSQRVIQKGCRVPKFVTTLPLIVPALTVFVAGEWVGYLLGPGDSLSKVE
jgi:glycosyltransferase involved in cell wall biosynthesis